jgi:sialate O-acetylesterase
MNVSGVENAKEEIANANIDNIRFFTVPQKGTVEIQNNIEAEWQICSPGIVGDKTATGYFFARKLSKELNAVVGLIDISYGGANILTFMDNKTIQSAENRASITMHDESREKMMEKRIENWEGNGRSANRPCFPQSISSLCYNAMVHPIIPFANRGAIWYQGEANVNAPDDYVHWFGDYISMMRGKFNNPEMPFYFVQLAGFENQYNTNIAPEVWAKFRIAQEQCLKYSYTGMVTAMDIGQKDNIHPKNKQ